MPLVNVCGTDVPVTEALALAVTEGFVDGTADAEVDIEVDALVDGTGATASGAATANVAPKSVARERTIAGMAERSRVLIARPSR
jgi:hypothetical protein